MLDLKIINATIIDGSGGPRYTGDLGVRDGRIAAVGEVSEPAAQTIDATGLVLSPGFIDAHTHYDAQAFWDPSLSPSCYHGVTTVVGGFCGFSIAPVTPEAADYLRPMLARVEGMPLETLEQAVPWGSWASFGEYLDQLEGKVGLNAGFFCGHSTIRRVAMGKRAVGNRATSAELSRMKELLADSLREGALGFSSTISPTHNDADGNPVPSRWADFSELLALAAVVRDFEGAGLELLPHIDFAPEVVELMADFSIAGNRPVNWNALVVVGNDNELSAQRAERLLAITDMARERGGEVIALTIPISPSVYQNLHAGFGPDCLPGLWPEIFKLPVPERIARLRDPETRRQLAADAAKLPSDSPLAFQANFGAMRVITTITPENKVHEGRRIAEIAAETGASPLDVLLDIAVADELRTTFKPDTGGESHESFALRGRLWQDDRTLIGASDAGAHLDMIDTFSFSTSVLERGVREHGVIELETAINRMTDRIARYYGLVDRGRIAVGNWADLVLFDPDTVGRGPVHMRHDLPGGAHRVYAEATGIPHVFVNGVQILRDGVHTGALPGTVLRSGRDTRTVAMDALREAAAAE